MAAKRKTLPVEAVAPEPAVLAVPPAPCDGDWRLSELDGLQCRFVCSEIAGQHRFCGRPTEKSESNGNRWGSWCDAHLPVVFEARTTRTPRARSGLALYPRRSA